MGNKVIVTGGAGVIGQAICRRLLQSGYVPVAADLQPAVDALDVAESGVAGALTVAMDVTDRENVTSAVASLVDDGETLFGLVPSGVFWSHLPPLPPKMPSSIT